MPQESLSHSSVSTTDEQTVLDADICLGHARRLYDDANIRLAEHQGGCSITMIATRPQTLDMILQMRPFRFAVDTEIMRSVTEVHGNLTPSVIDQCQAQLAGLRIQILVMTMLPGIRYSELQSRDRSLDMLSYNRLQNLVDGLADVFARSWHSPYPSQSMSGRIGRSLHLRLYTLSNELPDVHLRALARRVTLAVQNGGLNQLPITLTHGDLLPSNLLVDGVTGELTGVVDWAEAEFLPFGIALYGLDHLLGDMHTAQPGRMHFEYYTQAAELNQRFWLRLRRQRRFGSKMLQAVMLARMVGILLWHGFAWDDGRIDRVVNRVDDVEEVAYLKAMLATELSELSKPSL